MNLDLVPIATAIVPAVVAAWVKYRLGRRESREIRDSVRRQEAAQALGEPLREIRRLVRRHGRVNIGENEGPDVFTAWFDAYDRQHTPGNWRHLGRSIRLTVGRVFGASSFVDLRLDVDTYPLDESDSKWQTFSDDYISYCPDALAFWADDNPATPKALMDCDKWLVRTGRLEPFGQNSPA